LRSRILLGLIFGAAGGFLGFFIQEYLSYPAIYTSGGFAIRFAKIAVHDPILSSQSEQMRIGVVVGAMLGMALGAVEGVSISSSRLLVKGALLGLLIGMIGGLFGIYFGGAVYTMLLFGKDASGLGPTTGLLDFTQRVIARSFGWALLGGFTGLAAGAATMSRKRATYGLAGGLIGGFLGGLVFDLAATVITAPIKSVGAAASGIQIVETGGPSRAIGFTVIGALTGLFIGLVENFFKQAWVRVLAGKNEGKDYIITKPLTVLGRDERAEVPLFGDPALAPQHAAIKMENGRHLLLDGGTPLGSVVNGQRVAQQPQLLRDGDMIQLGQVRLLFREKATATKVGRPAVDQPKAAQSPGAVAMPSHLCPFCGAAKDASGNCLCTVPGASPQGGMPMGAPAPPVGIGAGPGYGDPMGYGVQPAPYGDPGFAAPVYGAVGSRLAALDGPYAGQVFPLVPGGTTIGRSPENGIPMVNDNTISRRHAHISEEAGQHVLYDDGSSNGTFVNNVRVTVQALAPGDVVQLGASKFRYE
jgi:pSer/pThr/pTyr-binding forkhead associated (FHA) protein